MTPYMSHGRGPPGQGKRGGKVICDCVLKLEYEMGSLATFEAVSFDTSYPDELRRRVENDWVGMGFDEI